MELKDAEMDLFMLNKVLKEKVVRIKKNI